MHEQDAPVAQSE